jgi:hypothetical protein
MPVTCTTDTEIHFRKSTRLYRPEGFDAEWRSETA